jgi:hypothetical protein
LSKFYFDLLGDKQDVWIWRKVDQDGVLVDMSKNTFSYYLDCVADASLHGYDGNPSFRPGTPKMQGGA